MTPYTPEKKKYECPSIDIILLDAEISLTMDSNAQPNSEPDWLSGSISNSPFKDLA